MSNDIPAVSVIIPVYNAAEFLKDGLNSLLKQTLREIEIICVDDGSTDGSLVILKEFEKADARIRVIHQENQGAGAARNNGMDVARGKYLAFLDADDFFEKNMLKAASRKNEPLSDNIPDSSISSEAKELLYALSDLPDSFKIPVYLFYYDGYSSDEIGHMLHITPSAVRSRLQKARELLRNVLDDERSVE